MSKIVQAVNAMVSNPKLITNIIQSDGELFFMYRGKYKWSMALNRESDEYLLWHYPGNETLESLASYEGHDWEGTPMVTYKTADIGTKEAHASFAELYGLLKERLYGMNEVLDDIISDADPL